MEENKIIKNTHSFQKMLSKDKKVILIRIALVSRKILPLTETFWHGLGIVSVTGQDKREGTKKKR